MSSEVLSKKPEDKTRSPRPLFRRPDVSNIQWYHLVLGAIAIAALIYFNMQTNGVFLSQRNLTLLLKQAAILGVVSAGMVVLIISRQIDLSAGMSVYLVSVVVAQLSVTYGLPVPVAVGAGMLVGLLLGAFQGLMVAKFAIPAFVVTLAGSMIFKGIGYVWTNATAIGPASQRLIWLSEGFISPAVSAVVISAVVALVVWATVQRGVRLARWEKKRSDTIKKVAT